MDHRRGGEGTSEVRLRRRPSAGIAGRQRGPQAGSIRRERQVPCSKPMMAEFIPAFLMTVLGLTEGGRHNPGKMRLIVRRPYAYLENRIRQAFAGHDVEVILDRRRGERRLRDRAPRDERRRDARRKTREEILEVVMEGDPLTMFQTTSQR